MAELVNGANRDRPEQPSRHVLQNRLDVADEMLAKLLDDVGTGPGLASIRSQIMEVKNEVRGLVRHRSATAL